MTGPQRKRCRVGPQGGGRPMQQMSNAETERNSAEKSNATAYRVKGRCVLHFADVLGNFLASQRHLLLDEVLNVLDDSTHQSRRTWICRISKLGIHGNRSSFCN